MADAFVGEIRMVAFNFAPTGWALCNGQLLPISQNTALFALLGTMYGGNGQSTFALPDLQDAAPTHFGTGPGLSQRYEGETGGVPFVTLLESEIPAHNHTVNVVSSPANVSAPAATVLLARSKGGTAYAASSSPLTALAPQALTPTGSSFPHNNLMPYLKLTFVIALQGTFPPRN
jgi:microcystin-dependent protein